MSNDYQQQEEQVVEHLRLRGEKPADHPAGFSILSHRYEGKIEARDVLFVVTKVFDDRRRLKLLGPS
jgi:hypothetical protein